MGRKKWRLGKLNKDQASQIASKFGIDAFLALLLSSRGLESDEEIERFLCRNTEFVDPFLLPDMDLAVDRINDAIFDYEKICIFGDYDADGVTSTALLYLYLAAQGANVTYMLPDRARDGYGLSMAVVDRIHELGTSLIITVDNGISAVFEADYIKSLGMDLVITDHHLPGDKLPDCVAVVDPHRTDISCPFKEYAGVGVAFKLACALEGDEQIILSDFADLVAVGTVADIVPLTGENRLLVKYGLNSLNNCVRPGLMSLMAEAGISGKEVGSSNISFGIAPRINAAGRMENAETALELLICDEENLAKEMAVDLNSINAKRHEIENSIFEECLRYLDDNPLQKRQAVIVVHGKGWHEGVLGIVASKVQEKFLKPVIILTDKENGVSKGSARSVKGFSIFDSLTSCSELLELYGGHDQAAGLTLKTENIDSFREKINMYAFENGRAYPELAIDCKLVADAITPEFVETLESLEPFGSANPVPVFGLFEFRIDSVSFLGDRKQHAKITAHKEGQKRQITVMKFNADSLKFPFVSDDLVDFVVTLEKNEWNGQKRVTVVAKDIRPSGLQEDDMVKSELLFDRIELRDRLNTEEAAYALPERNLFASVYTLLKHRCFSADCYEYILGRVIQPGDNICRVKVALEAMEELGLIKIDENNMIEVPEVSEKFDLGSAPVMRYISEFTERR